MEGTGAKPKSGNTVCSELLRTLTNGQEFDSSHCRTKTFYLPLGGGRVIRGYEGVVGMKEGGKRSVW